MKGKLFLGIWVLAVLAVSGAVQAQNQELWSSGEVTLQRIGTRMYSGPSGIIQEPIFAVRVGDTSRAEAEAAFWGPYFAEHSLNATLYVRVKKDKVDVWKAVTYRRPANPEEVIKFYEDPPRSFLAFYSERVIGAAELPEPFKSLKPEELSRIEFMMVYLIGGMKAYPLDGTSLEEARNLAERTAEALKK